MALTGVTPTQRVWVDKTEEKGSDVNLASHLVRDAYQQAFQVAVLITNDSDLAEPVRIVRQELNLPVGVLNPHQHHVDRTFHELPTLPAPRPSSRLSDVRMSGAGAFAGGGGSESCPCSCGF